MLLRIIKNKIEFTKMFQLRQINNDFQIRHLLFNFEKNCNNSKHNYVYLALFEKYLITQLIRLC